MPAPQLPVEFKSPLKGVIKNLSYSDLTPDLAVDALNVLPNDRAGRGRVAQRNGTSKLQASPIGSSFPVRAMTQLALSVDPLTIGANILAYEDKFAYTNGNLLNTTPWLVYNSEITVGANTWAKINNPPGEVGTLLHAEPDLHGATYAIPTASLSLGTLYKVKVDFIVSRVPTNTSYSLLFRIDPTNPNTGIKFAMSVVGSTGAVSYALASVGGGTTYASTTTGTVVEQQKITLELRVVGNAITCWRDGTQVLSATTSDQSTGTRVGFEVQDNDGAGNTVVAPNIRVQDFRVYIGNGGVFRQTSLIAIAGGNVYQGDNTALALVGSGTGVVNPNLTPGVTGGQGFVYIVDGTSILKVDVANTTMATYTATAGSAPTGCRLAAIYRDRLILAAPATTPQNFFCSRVGTHTDWDYSQTDPAAAFAGNASTAGHIGEPIISLMPFTDDVMLIGGDHNLWAMRGDPADGGSIDMVSDAIGVLGPYAWTKTPDGSVYFLGTGGLFKMSPTATGLTNVSSGKMNEFFRSIDRQNNYVSLVYDRDNHYLYVFITPTAGGAATHLLFDERGGGFWPLSFPAAHGPVSAIVYDGSASTDRTILMGGATGLIQKLDNSTSDDGTAISSYLYIGPYGVSDITEATLQWADVILSEPAGGFASSDFNVTVAIQAGQTVEKAVNSPRVTVSKTFTSARRQTRWLQRVRGQAFFVKLSNSVLNKTWGLEKIIGMFLGGGIVRRK